VIANTACALASTAACLPGSLPLCLLLLLLPAALPHTHLSRPDSLPSVVMRPRAKCCNSTQQQRAQAFSQDHQNATRYSGAN
jgi:hypothetical protein